MRVYSAHNRLHVNAPASHLCGRSYTIVSNRFKKQTNDEQPYLHQFFRHSHRQVPRLQRHHRRVIPKDRHSRTPFEEMSSTGRPQYWPSFIPIGSKTPLLHGHSTNAKGSCFDSGVTMSRRLGLLVAGESCCEIGDGPRINIGFVPFFNDGEIS